ASKLPLLHIPPLLFTSAANSPPQSHHPSSPSQTVPHSIPPNPPSTPSTSSNSPHPSNPAPKIPSHTPFPHPPSSSSPSLPPSPLASLASALLPKPLTWSHPAQ